MIESNETETREVEIPLTRHHDGSPFRTATVELEWVCSICGEPRGEPQDGVSRDGSRTVEVDTWENPCGHVDKYSDVRQEAAENGLNTEIFEEAV